MHRVRQGGEFENAGADGGKPSGIFRSPPQGGAGGLVGFSDRCNSPEILAAAQKNKKSSIGCMWILVFVPLIGFPIAGLLMDDFPFGESLVIGVGIALVMLVVNLLALRRTKQPMWEGVVVNKYSKEKSEHRGGEDDNYRTYTEYTTIINTDAGKKRPSWKGQWAAYVRLSFRWRQAAVSSKIRYIREIR